MKRDIVPANQWTQHNMQTSHYAVFNKMQALTWRHLAQACLPATQCVLATSPYSAPKSSDMSIAEAASGCKVTPTHELFASQATLQVFIDLTLNDQ